MINLYGKTYGKEWFILFHKDLFDCVKTQIECKTKKKKQTYKYFRKKMKKSLLFY